MTTTWAHNLWLDLKKDCAIPGTLLVFSEFQSIMNNRISNDSHLSIAIDKIIAHYKVLSINHLAIPESLKVLIILSKLPPHYNFIAQDFFHNMEMSNLDV